MRDTPDTDAEAEKPEALRSQEFFLQLHAKRYDQFVSFALTIAKTAISLNAGGVGILLSATVFGSVDADTYPVEAALSYCGGLLCALAALSFMYLFSTRVLGDYETYKALVKQEPYQRLEKQGFLLKSTNLLLFVSVVFFFAGTIVAAFSVSTAP